MRDVALPTMLKQSLSRNQRPKGFKVKHALHICLLLAICVWLLYWVKETYAKRAALVEAAGNKSRTGRMLKLGRKGLDPQVEEIASQFKKHDDEDDELDLQDEEQKLRENEGEEQRGAGDDELDGRDLDKAEDEEEPDQLEDLIHEGDKEKEVVEQMKENVEMDSLDEDIDLSNTQHRSGIRKNSEEANEERDEGNVGSQKISEKETGILRAVKEEEEVKNEVDEDE